MNPFVPKLSAFRSPSFRDGATAVATVLLNLASVACFLDTTLPPAVMLFQLLAGLAIANSLALGAQLLLEEVRIRTAPRIA